MWKLLLTRLGGMKIYVLIAGVAFGAGMFAQYKICDYINLKSERDKIEQIYEAEETAIKLKTERKKAKKHQIKEVKEYVKSNPTRPGLTDDELLLFNQRRN